MRFLAVVSASAAKRHPFVYPQKNSTIICAVKIRRNILSGYTVEYPIDGASLEQVELAYASAGGSV